MSIIRRSSILLGLFLLVLPHSSTFVSRQPVPPKSQAHGQSQPDPKAQVRIAENYCKLPLSFEANHGQSDPRVRFLSRGPGYTVLLTSDEAVFSLHEANTSRESRVFRPPAADRYSTTLVPPRHRRRIAHETDERKSSGGGYRCG
jgi:hypothetical protein